MHHFEKDIPAEELTINISHINPIDFFGVKHQHIHILRRHFPLVSIYTKGNQIRICGNKNQLIQCNKKIQYIIDYIEKKNGISIIELENILINETLIETNHIQTSDIIVHGYKGAVIKAQTPNQQKLVQASKQNDIVFAIGPAGTGKTYTAVALAVKALKTQQVKRIILTRPAVEAGEQLGFLPGNLKDKIDPYLRPLYDALDDMLSPEKIRDYIENRVIEIAPLAFMRGRTLDKAYIILDEAQNTTNQQLKMFLTRMGPSAKCLITGDMSQIDLPKSQNSGLKTTIEKLQHIQGIATVYLNGQDVVRHPLVKKIIDAYDASI